MINEIQPKIKFQNIVQCPFKGVWPEVLFLKVYIDVITPGEFIAEMCSVLKILIWRYSWSLLNGTHLKGIFC